MAIKEIKKRLESGDVKIQIKGVFNYNNKLKTLKMERDKEMDINSLHEDEIFGKGMNVEKFGPTCMWLFSYDMMGNKTKSKVKYSDIIIVED